MEMLKREQPVTDDDAAARLSLRVVTALEVASVTISVFITAWAIIPLKLDYRGLAAVPGLLALALMINSHRLRRETPSELGFTLRHFGRALSLLLLPLIIGGAMLAAIGYLNGSLSVKPRFWTSLTILPLWGMIQQYILQAFIYRRLKFVLVDGQSSEAEQLKRTWFAIFSTATLFALVHAPNLTLMALAFVAGVVWSWVYERAPNLFALGLSHVVMSALVLLSLPADSMRIGYEYFIYHGF